MINKPKYLVVDGSAIIHRAYHALPMFNTPSGIPTNALFGFIKMLISMADQLSPNFLSVVYDTPKPTFRKKLLATYQSQRPKAPEEFKVQVPLTQVFLDQAKVGYYLKEGYEADDVLATITRQAQKENPELQVYILTGDRDILQLVDKRTTVVMPKVGVSSVAYMDEAATVERMGIGPRSIVDYKALVGDGSDNYFGVKGIGPKTAINLLNKYGNLEEIYTHLSEISGRTGELLRDHKENAYLSQTLAKIVEDVDVDFRLEDNKFSGFTATPAVLKFCEEYSLRSVQSLLKMNRGKIKIEETTVDKTSDNQLSFF